MAEFADVRSRDATARDRGRARAGSGMAGARTRSRGCWTPTASRWPSGASRRPRRRRAGRPPTLGGPVAVKAVAPSLVHKTEAGAVRLGLVGAKAVAGRGRGRCRGLCARRDTRADAFLVQRMVPPGVEMLVGVVHDPLFGPVVACGAGGTAVELLKDVSVRITPLTDRDATDMIALAPDVPAPRRLPWRAEGGRPRPRGHPPAGRRMVEAHPEITEMDLNPVMVLPEGARIVDARIRVDTPSPPRQWRSRRRRR